MTSWIDHLLVGLQHLIPQHAVSKLAKHLAYIEQPNIKLFLIKRFLGAYDIDLNESVVSSLGDFSHFNAFFTRRLKPGARTISPGKDIACSPADGILSEFGSINQGTIIQAKGKVFSANDLLAEPSDRANRYAKGRFATIYLAPNNYHRVHTPITGEVISARYIPGDLFSVNRRTAQTVKGLFARNERVLVEFQTREFGRVMLVMVGALLVASIGLTFLDLEALAYSRRHTKPVNLPIPHKPLRLDKGQEVGWFNMGSTVVLLFENDAFALEPSLVRGQKIKLGEKLGAFAPIESA